MQLGPFTEDVAVPGRTDGLTRPWHGFVWCNPPYGPEVGAWLKKCAEHGSALALVFARTETRWFREYAWGRATGMLFLYGRLHFYKNGVRAKANSGAPSVLIAYGDTAMSRLVTTKLPGALVTTWRQ